MASRWPPLLSLADAERGSATRQVRSGASTAFLGVELSLSVDLCHPPQAPRRQPCPPPTPSCLRAGRSGRAGREAEDTAVRGERCPHPFESHLGEALAKHLRVPKASPAKSATFKRNQQIPPETGISGAGGRADDSRSTGSQRAREKQENPTCQPQGPGPQEQAQQPGGPEGGRRPRRALHRGLAGSVPPSSLVHGGRWSAGGQVPLRAPAKLLPGRPSASSRPDWAGSCQQPRTSRSSSRKAPSGEAWEPGEESGAHSPACRAAGRGRGLPMRRAGGLLPSSAPSSWWRVQKALAAERGTDLCESLQGLVYLLTSGTL